MTVSNIFYELLASSDKYKERISNSVLVIACGKSLFFSIFDICTMTSLPRYVGRLVWNLDFRFFHNILEIVISLLIQVTLIGLLSIVCKFFRGFVFFLQSCHPVLSLNTKFAICLAWIIWCKTIKFLIFCMVAETIWSQSDTIWEAKQIQTLQLELLAGLSKLTVQTIEPST